MKAKRFLKLLIVFSLGILLGAVSMRAYVFYEMSKVFDGGPAGPGMRSMILSHLDSELELSETQKAAVENEVIKVQSVIRNVEATFFPRLDQQISDSIDSLSDKLSIQQIERLKAIKGEFDQKRIRAQNR